MEESTTDYSDFAKFVQSEVIGRYHWSCIMTRFADHKPWGNGMNQLLFASTNRQTPDVNLAEALLQGQAPDKGLYLPVVIPRFSPGELASLEDKSYPEIAAAVLNKFSSGTFSPEEIDGMCRRAYDFEVPLEQVDSGRYVMRLDRGPTASFKDFAGRMMGQMFGALRQNASDKLVILTATSGDTGSAVAHAFYKIPNVEVMVLFPPAEVSPRQRKQMTTLGENITAIGVDGKFDDCQALVALRLAAPAAAVPEAGAPRFRAKAAGTRTA
jgi:threonine synthase